LPLLLTADGQRRSARQSWWPTVAAVSLGLFLLGCSSTPKNPPPIPRNFIAEVQAEFRESVAAWNGGDLNAFMGLYAEDATFSMGDSYLLGRQAIRDYYAPLFAPGAARDGLDFDELNVVVLCPEVVLVRALYRNTQGGQIVRRGTSTLILRFVLDRWLIIHDHSS